MCICLLSICTCVCACICVHCVCTCVHLYMCYHWFLPLTWVSLAESEGNVQGDDWGFKKFIRRGQCDDKLTLYCKVSSSHYSWPDVCSLLLCSSLCLYTHITPIHTHAHLYHTHTHMHTHTCTYINTQHTYMYTHSAH